MLLTQDVPLAPYTTFEIGGPARWFAKATSEEDVVEAVLFARAKGLPLFVLGGGSNLLVSDAGFPGLVLHIGLRGIEERVDGADRIFSVAAGEDWDQFVSLAVDRNCGGIECLAGIPGTVGGTPVQNVGAYGQEVSTTIRTVRTLDLESMTFVVHPQSACGFSYRRSIFNSEQRGRYIVSSVQYVLSTGIKPWLKYADLIHYFNIADTPPSLIDVSRAVREIRRRKGMLLVEGDEDCRSAGSFFKNPVVSRDQYEAIATNNGGDVPHYDLSAGQVKILAAWLLERAGFEKGFDLGRAGISSRHALALINRGGASARDILSLRDLIVAGVERKFSIRLEPEPVWVG